MNINDNKGSETVQGPSCPVCGKCLSLKFARGRKSGKAFIMVICPQDGKHFRGFISERNFVQRVVEQIEAAVKV